MAFSTPHTWINLLFFVLGFWSLIKGSDIFIESAAGIAKKYKVSELTIGLTLVSVGTALPEFASSLYATFFNQPDFVVGNVIGSITTNSALMLGIGCVLAGTMTFPRKLLTRDAAFMFLTFIVTALLVSFVRIQGANGNIVPGVSRWGGLILLGLGIGYCFLVFRQSKDSISDSEELKGILKETDNLSIIKCFMWLALGLTMVFLGSKLLLDNAIWLALKLNISMVVISATLVAFGTALPELAVTITGIMKKRHDMVIGNIIGSNILNISLIIGVCSLIKPLKFAGFTGVCSLIIMLIGGATLISLMIMGRGKLTRASGIVLILFYIIFITYNCRDFFIDSFPIS